MNSETFIEAVRTEIYESAISGVIEVLTRPPGRAPRPALVALSEWYNRLSDIDKRRVSEVVTLSVHDAIFSMLAGLDGECPLGPETIVLRGDDTDLTADHDLHDTFQAAVASDLF